MATPWDLAQLLEGWDHSYFYSPMGRQCGGANRWRLFACACLEEPAIRQHLFRPLGIGEVVGIARRVAKGLEATESLALAHRMAQNERSRDSRQYRLMGRALANQAAVLALDPESRSIEPLLALLREAIPPARLEQLMREIVGDPWRWYARKGLAAEGGHANGMPWNPVLVREEWLQANDRQAARLVEYAWESDDFSGLPILADALEEAGCSLAHLLDHLRGKGPHVPGCWALYALYQEKRPCVAR